MYREIFDSKHRLHEVQITTQEEIGSKIRQTGAYEAQLLCPECDNELIGKLETYASKALYGGIPLALSNVKYHGGLSFTQCNEIDYSKFKLFLLSLVWRASVSSLPIFKTINLGHYEEILRKMIFGGIPGEPLEYPCLMFSFFQQNDIPHQLIIEPGVTQEDNGYTCFFMISGFFLVYFIGHHNFGPWGEAFLNLAGEMKIIHLPAHLAAYTLNKAIGSDVF